MATAANEEIVGEYRVIKDKLGAGTYGTVYKAEHVSKKYHFAAAKKITVEKQYLKIAECEKEKDLLMNRIPPHENIIKVYDVVLKEYIRKGVPMVDIWLLMEYAPFGNLKEFAQEHDLTVEEKVKLMLDCALGVQHLHSCKPQAIAHRDIKPENVVITGSVKNPTARLCDFGEGKAIGKKSDLSSVTMRSVTGTPKYAAPEQHVLQDGHAAYDKSVDVYSLGVTFDALLDCSPGKVMVPSTLDDIQNRPSNTPLHKAVKDIIQNMVQLKPSDRIPIGDVVARLRVCKSLGYGRVMKDMGESPRRGQAPDARDGISDPGSPQPEAFNEQLEQFEKTASTRDALVRQAPARRRRVLDEEAMAALAMGPGAQHFIEEVNTLILRVGEYEVIDAAEEATEDKKEVIGGQHESYVETLIIDMNIMKYFSMASKMPVDSSKVRVTFQPLEGTNIGQVTLKSTDKERLKVQVAKFRAACDTLAGTITKKKVTLEAMGAVDRNIGFRFPDVHVDLQEDLLVVELIGPKRAVREAKKEVIRLSKQPVRPKTSSSPQSPSERIGSSADSVEPMSFWALANPKRTLHVHALVHDITRMQVDVIVNAANEKLRHGGGIAKKIADVGGQELEDDCKAYIKKNKKIKVTNHYISKPGRLPCKHVMHAVGPIWSKDTRRREGLVSQLQETFRKCLMAASDKDFKSIAIPPISAGIFGFHPAMVATLMAKAVADFARVQNHNLSDIYLVDILPDTVQIIQKQLQNHDILTPEVSFTCGNSLVSLPNMPHQGRRRRVLDEEEHVGPGTGAVDEAEKRRATMAYVRTQDPLFASGGPQSPLNLSRNFASYTYVPAASSSQPTSSKPSRSQSYKPHTFASRLPDPQVTRSQASSSKVHKADPTKAEPDDCPICLDPVTDLARQRLDKCGHEFCKDCIQDSFQHKPVCPLCGVLYGKLTGNQPTNGTMKDQVNFRDSLPGYSGCGIIVIDYHFPSGIQGDEHPQPGKRYRGAIRCAYLPDNAEGRKVLRLLREAFDARLVFTIRRSVISGLADMVSWNGITHKTNVDGGPERYGYPDPTYLSRVTQELAAKGITPETDNP